MSTVHKNTNKPSLTPLSSLGEFGLIKHISRKNRMRQPSTIKSIGDDAAVLQPTPNKLQVITTDMLVEGIHFDLMYTPLKHLGYKAVVVNLSDVYAMNALPTQITVSLALSSRFTVEALDQIYAGIYAACELYGVDLVGGDTSSSKKGLIISVTALGEVDKDKVVYRNTAKVGDLICVSGDLGGAYLGLQLLEREKAVFLSHPDVQPELEKYAYPVERQLKPEARKDILDILATYDIVPSSMIDISDGLSSDLLHICTQSDVGCQIFEENIPVHTKTFSLSQLFKMSPITCALNGGEDYELLFTVHPKHLSTLSDIYGLSVIGRIVPAEQGRKLFTTDKKGHDLIAQGWKHI